MSTDKLKPCPFCGGKVLIGISDDEGNRRNEEYENDPWSGLTYTLIHEYEDGVECPIATHHGELLGSRLYESREEATGVWNDRDSCLDTQVECGNYRQALEQIVKMTNEDSLVDAQYISLIALGRV